jgi:hypothetical protein
VQLQRIAAAAAVLGLAAMLSACGGGGDGESHELLTAQNMAGLWNGTADDQREVSAVTLSDGRYFAVYSGANGGATIAGGVQGTATVSAGDTLTSSDLLAFSVEGGGTNSTGTFTATEIPKFALTGRATVPNQPSSSFEAHYESDFEQTATLAGVAGSYTGEAGFALGLRPATFNIGTDGVVTSTINGCDIRGNVTPRSEGNVFDLSVTFSGPPCALPNLTFTGVVFLRHRGQQLYSVSRNTPARQTIIFTGLKQPA